jgi:UDP-glucose 4-epimerase
LKGAFVPTLLGYDPLFQFMHERDVARAIALAIERRLRGVFNVVGPPPLPLSILVRETGRRAIALPELVYALALGRFGLPKLQKGALGHIRYPVIVDGSAFRMATAFAYELDEATAMRDFREAFPPPRRKE